MHQKLREHIEKIIQLTDDEFSLVLSHFNSRSFKKKEFLIDKGDTNIDCYYIVSGLLKLIYEDENGNEHIISFAMEDWWESDFIAFFTQTNATMSLQCIEDTDVFCISIENYQKLCAVLQKMEHFLLKKSNSGHIASQRRILSFLTSSAKDRYDLLLKQHPSLFQRVNKTMLASYLGVSRETLSRLSS
ncbi:Crp/Fnr family transcriptional regulator [Flavobacterium sp. CLA17]|uniref:Crp/Fnr family transcriptional regulator n=1 Tax=Flavobacterium sp. CLA17 TaxID=2724135 RepID=UPI0014927C31|nr:Crp/Fnr family transcriptional regulator [Flavobacterium sp. CLA17]QSB25647.1 Crp/Fnr family transcriptional regulator [Flavobacterium sp. CLA17]